MERPVIPSVSLFLFQELEQEDGWEEAIESQTEAEPESQTEPEEQSEEQREDPVDVELDDYLNTSVVLQNASSIGFDRVQIQW